jgi:hypothetical protein
MIETLVRAILGPVADLFSRLPIPEPIVHWGHPVMMGIVVLVMGSFGAIMGWQGRLATETTVVEAKLTQHKTVILWMFLFIVLGYSGGILSLIIQGQDILASPHFWSGTVAIGLLAVNGLISVLKFGGKPGLRTAHAYIGSVALGLLLLHGILGLQLGLSI